MTETESSHTEPKSNSGLRFSIIVSKYNASITDRLAEGATDFLIKNGIERASIEIHRVPGAWELPLAAKWSIESGRFDGVIVLGAVIKGETTHDEHINRFVSMSSGQLSLDSGIPIAFGLLTCNTLQQAVERAGGRVGNKGEEAAEAALEMVLLKDKFQLDT
ncbi:MAG: 6,7-dimethyl-8-ribityllumazine synthase [Pirellulaceae bacterium]